jgi:ATP-binding cassette, subfamily B, multidrug efflux pump
MSGAAIAADPARASRRTTWGTLAPILRPWRGVLALVAAILIAARVLDLAPALILRRVVDDHLAPGRTDGLLALGMLYLGAVVAAQVANFVAVYLTAIVAQDALRALRVRLAAHLQRLPLAYHDRTPVGDSISRCTADVEAVDTLFSSGAINLVGNLVRLATALGAMLLLSVPLTLVALLVVPPLAILTRFFQVRVRAAERANRRAVGLLNTHLQETIAGADVVHAFAREATFVARCRLALRDALLASNRSTRYASLYTPITTLLAAVATATLLWAGATGFAASWGVSLGTLTAFVLVFGRFFEPITALGDDWQTVQGAFAGIERIVEVLALPPEEWLPAAPASGDVAGLVVRDLVFGYAPGHPVVRGVSLTVRPGEQVALVGRTGAGKTSIVQLVAGFYPAWSGSIAVAGRDPRALADDERRDVVAVVPQQVQLFAGTVRDNLTLGDPAVDQAAVERAVALVSAAGVVVALPQGYDTPLRGVGRGEGVQLSAGQRQLLALARALVREPAVLLLDEATVALDGASDAAFRAALRADVRGGRRAILTVAHRLATARAADRVIVLDAGRIVEEGPPDELIRRGGRFAALVELEAAGWDWREA